MEHNESKPKKEKKPLTWKWVLAYCAIGAVFLAGVVMLWNQYSPPKPNENIVIPTQAPVTPTPVAIATPTQAAEDGQEAAPESTPGQRDIEVPYKIYFPVQKLEAPIVPVGIEEGNEMGKPDTAHEVGWWYYSPSPGDPGTSILTGHQMWKKEKGVFSVLRSVNVGDQIIIEFEGGLLRYFEVDRTETYKAADVPVEYRSTGPDMETQLVLITCKGDYGGDGFSRSRVVAICKERVDLRRADDPFVENSGGSAEE